MSGDNYELEHILAKSRDAKNGGFGVLSTGEKLAAALVLNRADWLADVDYTLAEAIDRVGPTWLALIPEAARLLAYEAEQAAEPKGHVYQADNGQWSWVVERDGEPLVNGAGYDTEGEADGDMQDHLASY